MSPTPARQDRSPPQRPKRPAKVPSAEPDILLEVKRARSADLTWRVAREQISALGSFGVAAISVVVAVSSVGGLDTIMAALRGERGRFATAAAAGVVVAIFIGYLLARIATLRQEISRLKLQREIELSQAEHLLRTIEALHRSKPE